MQRIFRGIVIFSIALFTFESTLFASAVVRTSTGANPAAIQSTIDQFRADLGGSNNGIGGSFTSGRREIDWDGVPDNLAAPNSLPSSFFNVDSPRGVEFQTSNIGSGRFFVSADSNNPTATQARFGNLDPSYVNEFPVFSSERLFVAQGAPIMDVTFFIPGTRIPATVNGFGVVFSDPDTLARIRYFDAAGTLLATAAITAVQDRFLGFIGVSFDAGERVARVEITAGDTPIASGNIDTNATGGNVVAMDDFIYGEPRTADYHPGDFDGDGTTDISIYRPATGQWFRINSGSDTVTVEQFGVAGDISLDGDWDGDKRADVAIFRPSDGNWWIKRSSDGQLFVSQWGVNGDKPVVGDYDKDGISDIAIWRPSEGGYYIRNSSAKFNSLSGFQWGAKGVIPPVAAPQ